MLRLCLLILGMLPLIATAQTSAPATRPRPILPRPVSTRPGAVTRIATTLPRREVPASRPAGETRAEAQVELLALCVGQAPNEKPLEGAGEVEIDIHVKNLGGDILGYWLPLIVDRLVDDKGTVLLTKSQLLAKDKPYRGELKVSPKRDAAAILLGTTVKPADNATKIILEGTAQFCIGTEKETTKIDSIAVAFGRKFNASGETYTITNLTKYGPGFRHDGIAGDDTQISFSGMQNVGTTEIRIFSKDGKRIGFGESRLLEDKPILDVRCYAKEPPAEIALEVDCCRKIKFINVPIKIEGPIAGSFYIARRPTTYEQAIELSKKNQGGN